MTTYVALLRGINVGGHNKIKMADLRSLFQSLGLQCVQTYIQSGNVLFDSADDEDTLRGCIEQEIERVFSLSVTVVLRTSVELNDILTHCPFPETIREEAQDAVDVETLYVSLLLKPPTQQDIERLSAFSSQTDEFRTRGREVYLLLRQGMRNSKLASSLSKLGVSTTRNWKTLMKLNALAQAMP